MPRLFLVLAVALAPMSILAQPNEAAAPKPGDSPATAAAADRAWAFSVAAYGYIVPNDSDYLQPTVTADRGWLHLEARYNYEARKTGSAWVGYNYSAGEQLTFEVTPMLGFVFGETAGIAPGYKASLAYRRVTLYTEGEYVFDASNSADNFFYTWSELSFAPVDAFRFGLVIQRTKAYKTQFEIQRGLLAGFTARMLEFTTYVFNLDGDPAVVLAVAVTF